MNIYIVSHYYDNGEEYEDRMTSEDHEFYSTFEKASNAFWTYVTSDYEGKYKLISKTLDTQEAELLEESAWIDCSPWYPDEEWQGDTHNYDSSEGYYEPDPMYSCKEAWDYLEMEEQGSTWTELELEDEYLHSKGTNYQEWEAVNKEIEERKTQIELESLNEMLEELLTI